MAKQVTNEWTDDRTGEEMQVARYEVTITLRGYKNAMPHRIGADLGVALRNSGMWDMFEGALAYEIHTIEEG